MPFGYCGKILRVDLTHETVREETLEEELVKKFLGGPGLGSKLLFDEVPAKISAFDPQNKLIVMNGILTGTHVPAAARYAVVFKSPQTGGYGEATAGGKWGSELKGTRYDGIIVEGCARSPRFLVVTNKGAEIRDGSSLWGKDTLQTERQIQEELGKDFKVTCIGPAGENLVSFAAMINDKGRAAGRTGPGAVMGSKKLKAIAVKGDKKPDPADPAGLKTLFQTVFKKMQEHPVCKFLNSQGTPGNFMSREALGYGIVKNWQLDFSEFTGREQLFGERLNKEFLVRKDACFNCPIACGRITKTVLDGNSVEAKGPEYETMGALGSQCWNSDMDTLIRTNHLCNILGMDTISTGGVLAFAMECYERGLIPEKLLGGKKIVWGDGEIMMELIKNIAFKKGALGEMLSRGVKYASESIGGEAYKYAVQVRGVEAAEHDPRSCQGWGLAYAVGSAGARHTEGGVWPELGAVVSAVGLSSAMDRTAIEGKPRALILVQDFIASVMNSLGLCYFAYGFPDLSGDVPALFEAATGYKFGIQDFLRCGERSFNVKRMFNAREGLGKKDDVLPERFTHHALSSGKSKGLVARTAEMLGEYYQLRGWDAQTGWPTREKLLELSLEEESKALYGGS